LRSQGIPRPAKYAPDFRVASIVECGPKKQKTIKLPDASIYRPNKNRIDLFQLAEIHQSSSIVGKIRTRYNFHYIVSLACAKNGF